MWEAPVQPAQDCQDLMAHPDTMSKLLRPLDLFSDFSESYVPSEEY